MSFLVYLLLFLGLLILGLIIFYISTLYRKNNHTALYSKGIRNENDGNYKLAVDNYEDALSEMRKMKTDSKLGEIIARKIKILRTTIDYEKNFQNMPRS